VSVITKIFVIALVVLSLLLSAASITFVNTVDDYARSVRALETERNSLQAQISRAESESQEVQAGLKAELDQKTAANVALDQDNKKVREDLNKALADLASARSTIALNEGNISKLTSALAASEGTKSLTLQQVADLRATLDRTQAQLGDINVQFSDVSNKLEVTEAARRNLAEQLTEVRGQLDKVSGVLRDRGIDPNRITTSGVLAGAPPINGVIRETRTLSGVPHATISVGSEDGVKNGMEFKILDRANGRFLGTLTIISTEPNLAIGRLAGPDVAAITSGAEVRTQL
jgi:septal ring factor EnvC (AmiA/AmiB activator)